jgi:hypothetical protein
MARRAIETAAHAVVMLTKTDKDRAEKLANRITPLVFD